MSYYVNWIQNGKVLVGNNGVGWVNDKLIYPISFPSSVTDPQNISLQSSSLISNKNYVLKNVYLYLIGEDANTIQNIWPYLGGSTRPELNGGLEISFDGINWTRFNHTTGLKSARNTWLLLSSESTGNAQDGVLGPLDVANLMIRYIIPYEITLYKVLDVSLGINFEVV